MPEVFFLDRDKAAPSKTRRKLRTDNGVLAPPLLLCHDGDAQVPYGKLCDHGDLSGELDLELGPKNSCSPMGATIPTSRSCQRACGEVEEQEESLVFCVRFFPVYLVARLMKTSGVRLFSFNFLIGVILGEASIIPSDAPIICMREFGCRERLFLFLSVHTAHVFL